MAIEIREIDYVAGCLITSTDEVLPIVDFFDAHGRRTEKAAEAVLCIAGRAGKWVGVKLTPRARTSLH
jgi:hypothetical protein